MIKEFTNFLSSSDIEYKDGNDGTVTFGYNGLNFLFVSEKNDPNYVRIILPNIAMVDSSKDKAQAFEYANEYNQKYKAIKMTVTENSIWLSIEQFLYSHENARELFKRMIGILVAVIEDFRNNHTAK